MASLRTGKEPASRADHPGFADRAMTAAGVAYLLVDSAGRITGGSAGVESFLGVSPEGCKGLMLTELLPENGPSWFERFRPWLEGRDSVPPTCVLNNPYSLQIHDKLAVIGAPCGSRQASRGERLIVLKGIVSQVEAPVSHSRDRLLRQFNALFLELSHHAAMSSEAPRQIFQIITEASAELLGAERVSVWLYDEHRSEIRCADLYERKTGFHSDGMVLMARQFPSYFAALEENRTISAHDARSDRRTMEFRDSYLDPLGITSLLDAPIRFERKAVGVICHEHVGDSRVWSAEDEVIAGSMADLVAMALQASELRAATAALAESERTLRAQRDLLEQTVEERTRELQQSNHDLRQFAYIASHDLQEPLRTVRSFVELVTSRHGEQIGSEGLELLGFAVDGARRMQTLIRDLLSYSRVETHAASFHKVDLGNVLNQSLDNLRAQIEDSSARIERGPLPTVKGDEGQLVQLMQNLLSNAIKYRGDSDPQVRVSARRDKNQWRIEVEDDGIGIDPEHHQRIFELFERLHTRDSYPGTGIGLAVCKRIVTRHRGEIGVETPSGGGSRFYFTLPDERETDS